MMRQLRFWYFNQSLEESNLVFNDFVINFFISEKLLIICFTFYLQNTLKEKIGEKTVEEQADKTVHESVFTEVLGSDSHGRVRLYGSGVSSKQVFGTKAKQIEEQNVKIQEQNEKIKKLEENMQAQEEFN